MPQKRPKGTNTVLLTKNNPSNIFSTASRRTRSQSQGPPTSTRSPTPPATKSQASEALNAPESTEIHASQKSQISTSDAASEAIFVTEDQIQSPQNLSPSPSVLASSRAKSPVSDDFQQTTINLSPPVNPAGITPLALTPARALLPTPIVSNKLSIGAWIPFSKSDVSAVLRHPRRPLALHLFDETNPIIRDQKRITRIANPDEITKVSAIKVHQTYRYHISSSMGVNTAAILSALRSAHMELNFFHVEHRPNKNFTFATGLASNDDMQPFEILVKQKTLKISVAKPRIYQAPSQATATRSSASNPRLRINHSKCVTAGLLDSFSEQIKDQTHHTNHVYGLKKGGAPISAGFSFLYFKSIEDLTSAYMFFQTTQPTIPNITGPVEAMWPLDLDLPASAPSAPSAMDKFCNSKPVFRAIAHILKPYINRITPDQIQDLQAAITAQVEEAIKTSFQRPAEVTPGRAPQ